MKLALKSGIAHSLEPRRPSAQPIRDRRAVRRTAAARYARPRPLHNGDVIPSDHTSVPPNITGILDATNTALQAIPKDNLKTVIDESATAFGGLGPDLSASSRGSPTSAIDARANLDSITTLIDGSAPILKSQADTSNSIAAWAANVASLTGQLRDHDAAMAGVLQNGAAATGQVQQLLDRVKPDVAAVAGQSGQHRPDRDHLPRGLGTDPGAACRKVWPTPRPPRRRRSTHRQDRTRRDSCRFNLNLNLPPPLHDRLSARSNHGAAQP